VDTSVQQLLLQLGPSTFTHGWEWVRCSLPATASQTAGAHSYLARCRNTVSSCPPCPSALCLVKQLEVGVSFPRACPGFFWSCSRARASFSMTQHRFAGGWAVFIHTNPESARRRLKLLGAVAASPAYPSERLPFHYMLHTSSSSRHTQRKWPTSYPLAQSSRMQVTSCSLGPRWSTSGYICMDKSKRAMVCLVP